MAAGDVLLAPSVTRRLIADFAKQRPADRGKPALRLKGLTERETDVITLVARGRSNGESAQTLAPAGRTVKRHVSRVLTKLDLRDRAQTVVVAYESGLVTPGEWARPATPLPGQLKVMRALVRRPRARRWWAEPFVPRTVSDRPSQTRVSSAAPKETSKRSHQMLTLVYRDGSTSAGTS